MSSCPGYELEDYIAWRNDLMVVDGHETNVSVGMATALGMVQERRRPITVEQLKELCCDLQEYRVSIEDALSDFDEERQGWRSYASAVEARVPDDVWEKFDDQVDQFYQRIKDETIDLVGVVESLTPERKQEIVDCVERTVKGLIQVEHSFLIASTRNRIPESKVELFEELRKFIENNPSANVPYHNNRHMLSMTSLAFWLYQGEHQTTPCDQDATVILVAGMLHDYGHSAGHKPDSENIATASEAALRFIRFSPYMQSLPAQRLSLITRLVLRAIECTEFPFVKEPVSDVEKVLRDADVLYATLEGEPSLIMVDLHSEMQVAYGREISRQEMIDGQTAFVKSAKLYTSPGKHMFAVEGPGFIELLNNFSDQ